MKKEIFLFFLLIYSYGIYCQNEKLLNLIKFVGNTQETFCDFNSSKQFNHLEIRNVGEFFGTDDNYLLISVDGKSPHYIKGEFLKYDTSSRYPLLYVRYPKCCGGDITLYKCYRVDISRDTFLLVEQLSVADAIDISLLEHMDSIQYFFNNRPNILLRSSPEMNNEIWVDELRQKGNYFGKLSSGAEGYIITQVMVSNKKFYLAVIKNNKYCSVVWRDYDDTFFLCWIEYD